MSPEELSSLILDLVRQGESECVEWKHNNADPEIIGKLISAMANSAALYAKPRAYLIWGIQDDTQEIVGTTFQPRQQKTGNEELENWLLRMLEPQVHCQFLEWTHLGHRMVLLEIGAATRSPVRFQHEAFIRVGSLTKKLKDHHAIETRLWGVLLREPFETGIALTGVSPIDVLSLLDYGRFLKLLGAPLPVNQAGILSKLTDEQLIIPTTGGGFHITNLGAILFAYNLRDFPTLSRKALRIIKFIGDSVIETEREWRDIPATQGYAIAFEPALAFIQSQLPQNEPIEQALSRVVQVYPEVAIRELLANCLMHQDFSLSGTGPMVKIFQGRIEITNPGMSLIETLRFIDAPPRSRNPSLVSLMRRMKFCEEAGTGIDKVVFAIEQYQLPPPDFSIVQSGSSEATIATLYAPRELREMNLYERIRACYQHACLLYVSGKMMTNTSLRERLGVEPQNYSAVSRVIRDTLNKQLVKPFDPTAGKRYLKYVPFWA